MVVIPSLHTSFLLSHASHLRCCNQSIGIGLFITLTIVYYIDRTFGKYSLVANTIRIFYVCRHSIMVCCRGGCCGRCRGLLRCQRNRLRPRYPNQPEPRQHARNIAKEKGFDPDAAVKAAIDDLVDVDALPASTSSMKKSPSGTPFNKDPWTGKITKSSPNGASKSTVLRRKHQQQQASGSSVSPPNSSTTTSTTTTKPKTKSANRNNNKNGNGSHEVKNNNNSKSSSTTIVDDDSDDDDNDEVVVETRPLTARKIVQPPNEPKIPEGQPVRLTSGQKLPLKIKPAHEDDKANRERFKWW
jgi:hypothetical protein